MENVILFRGSLAEEGELIAAKKHFPVIESRADIKPGQTIIGRYSVLPYYKELEIDVEKLGGKLINSFSQHQQVSDIFNWYHNFSDGLTPKTWFALADVPRDRVGAYFLKGQINSRKQLWFSHAYAANHKEMTEVYFRLMDDSLISHQGVCIREHVDLVKYDQTYLTGCPITKEFRIFIYNGKEIARGYYWSNFYEEVGKPDPAEIPQLFIDGCISRMDFNGFWTLDVGQLTNGTWIVIELGDGQMAGLSAIPIDDFYRKLAEAVKESR